MNDERPGYNTVRTVSLMVEAVARLDLDLSGLTVLTEAATGPFAVTPVLAAMAGADRVIARARSSSFGTTDQAFEATRRLAAEAGVEERIECVRNRSPETFGAADIVTNSGHLRPLDRQAIGWLKPTAVIPLMYEGWEHRPGDVDRSACERRHIPLVGTNERDHRIGVFDYLGPAAAHLLVAAGIEVLHRRILLLCGNPFGSWLSGYLRRVGAEVRVVTNLEGHIPEGPYDAVLVAQTPGAEPAVGPEDAARLSRHCPGRVVVQFWGDLDREALASNHLSVWPTHSPGPGRMGILLSDLGPEPAVRLQAGGLKVGQILARTRQEDPSPEGCRKAVREALQSGFGSPLDGQEDDTSHE
jgi:hypothetical protein